MSTRSKLILLLLFTLPLLGCAMPQSPPSGEELDDVLQVMTDYDQLTEDQLVEAVKTYQLPGVDKTRRQVSRIVDHGKGKTAGKIKFRYAYLNERLGNYKEAIGYYETAAADTRGTDWSTQATFRVGEVALWGKMGSEFRGRAINAYNAGGSYATARFLGPKPREPEVWIRSPRVADQVPATYRKEGLRTVSFERLDRLYRNETGYQVFNTLVEFSHSAAVALVLLALLAKLITTPLTNIQLRSMKKMQQLQPLMKEMQEKHKGDRAAMAQAQMKLFKENKVNPMGGCLPMLIQLPILIWVYNMVNMYKYHFASASFLWVKNLADPDMILLILYTVSMYFSMKLTTPPSADPQQQSTQRMMSTMMPVMFLIMFQGMASAFILYWLCFNVFSTLHQMYVMRAMPATLPAATEASKPLSGPPRRRRK